MFELGFGEPFCPTSLLILFIKKKKKQKECLQDIQCNNTYCAAHLMYPFLIFPQFEPSAPRLFRSKHTLGPTLDPVEQKKCS